jgi:hypothetical protein
MIAEKKIKGLYQSAKIRIPEVLCNTVAHYSFENTLNDICNSNLNKRISGLGSTRFNVMAICPINNWETQLLDELKDGNDYAHLDFGARGFFKNRTEWNEFKYHNSVLLREFFQQNYNPTKLNLVFMYISDFHISDNLDYLKCQNTIVILFTWDDKLHFKSKAHGQSVGIVNLAKKVDIVLNMTVSSLPRYKVYGIPVINWNSLVKNLLPFDCKSPRALPKITDESIMFFGSNYGFRETVVNHLVKKNIPINLYGNGWGTEFIPYEDLEAKIPTVRLNLGISTVAYTHSVFCLKGRDFEVPAAGGLYLSNASLELQEVYTPGRDILTYNDTEACYRMCSNVLEKPNLYEKIRKNGFQTSSNYSWKRRVEALFLLISTIGR